MTVLGSHRDPQSPKQTTPLIVTGSSFLPLSVLTVPPGSRTRLIAAPPNPAYSTSSFCIFVTTRFTNPLIALWTLEGLKVSVIPVQTSCPSGAPLTK
jgi:hypothetical protein